MRRQESSHFYLAKFASRTGFAARSEALDPCISHLASSYNGLLKRGGNAKRESVLRV
jgi:hypothetical protein